MKKSWMKDQEQKRKLRRLGLNRETLRFLDDPAHLELARGGGTHSGQLPTCTTQSDSAADC